MEQKSSGHVFRASRAVYNDLRLEGSRPFNFPGLIAADGERNAQIIGSNHISLVQLTELFNFEADGIVRSQSISA